MAFSGAPGRSDRDPLRGSAALRDAPIGTLRGGSALSEMGLCCRAQPGFRILLRGSAAGLSRAPVLAFDGTLRCGSAGLRDPQPGLRCGAATSLRRGSAPQPGSAAGLRDPPPAATALRSGRAGSAAACGRFPMARSGQRPARPFLPPLAPAPAPPPRAPSLLLPPPPPAGTQRPGGGGRSPARPCPRPAPPPPGAQWNSQPFIGGKGARPRPLRRGQALPAYQHPESPIRFAYPHGNAPGAAVNLRRRGECSGCPPPDPLGSRIPT